MEDEFRDIPGFKGLKATSFGRIIGRNGGEIGCVKNKYVIIGGRYDDTDRRKTTTISRGNLILRAFVGPPPPDKPEVDHINRNKHDDRPENLRWADRLEQMHNRNPAPMKNSTTGTKGLYLHKNTIPGHSDRWRCSIRHFKVDYVKHFRLAEKDEAIQWLKEKRAELGIE